MGDYRLQLQSAMMETQHLGGRNNFPHLSGEVANTSQFKQHSAPCF